MIAMAEAVALQEKRPGRLTGPGSEEGNQRV